MAFKTVRAKQASMRILVIEDDQQAAGFLIKGLREEGHIVDHAARW